MADRYRMFYETVRVGGLSSADALLGAMMDTAIDVADADRGFLFLSRDGKVSCPVARKRGREDIPAPTEKMSGQIIGEALRARATIAHEGRGDLDSPLSQSARALGVKSFLATPLRTAGRIVGFGYLDRLQGVVRAFSPEQKATVKAFFNDMAALVEAVEEHRATGEKAERLRATVAHSRSYPNIVGQDEKLLALLRDVHAAASSAASVLLLGETGTGKELVARAIQRGSDRAERPYFAFNCAAVTRELADSELFGHVRGAFTGASEHRAGLFEEASSGTLFLDEIGDMSPDIQAKILRVLENGEVRRVGESRVRKVDVRIIAASSRDLDADGRDGRFRRDLLFRLNVISLKLPALRERSADIPLLADHFLEQLRCKYPRRVVGFRRAALEAMAAYHWPGNVRELENAIERAVVLASGTHIDASDLRLGENQVVRPPSEASAALAIPLESENGLLSAREVERLYYQALLDAAGHNRSEVARMARLPRTTVLRRLRALGLLGPKG